MDWLVMTGRAAIPALLGIAVASIAVPIDPAEAQDAGPPQSSYTCRFDNGLRAGQSLTYTDVSGPEIAIGTPCGDGQGSTGSVVPVRPVQAPPPVQPPAVPRRQDMTFICRFDEGPRSGEAQSYAGVTGIQPFPVGAPCTDGQGSTGVAIAPAPPPAPPNPPAPPPPVTSFSCRFDNGPRTGQTQSYSGVTGIQPMLTGAQCTDGQGSTGLAVPDAPARPPAPAVSAPPPPASEALPAPPPTPEPLPAPPARTPPHTDRVAGAAVGASVRGLSGAKWADPNNSGSVTGYIYKGRYHRGAPPGYDPVTATVTAQSVASKPAILPAPAIPANAIVGGAVRDEPGAVWADLNNDGVADGYVEDGRYFPGVPPGFTGGADSRPLPPLPPAGAVAAPPVTSIGERGLP